MGPGSDACDEKRLQASGSARAWSHGYLQGLGFKEAWLDWLFLRHSHHDDVISDHSRLEGFGAASLADETPAAYI